MNVFEYLKSAGVEVKNPLVLYQLTRLDNEEVKLSSLIKARNRATDQSKRNGLDLAITIYQRYTNSLH